jgi:TPP-dependent pyruvate/acetoin dehydrogenase alpha subunit
MIGSAAALGPKDIITCQYRETGMFLQRGFTLEDFMSQLTANRKDPGKGRNMPVHYSGKLKVGAVGSLRTIMMGPSYSNSTLSMPLHQRSEHRSLMPWEPHMP